MFGRDKLLEFLCVAALVRGGIGTYTLGRNCLPGVRGTFDWRISPELLHAAAFVLNGIHALRRNGVSDLRQTFARKNKHWLLPAAASVAIGARIYAIGRIGLSRARRAFRRKIQAGLWPALVSVPVGRRVYAIGRNGFSGLARVCDRMTESEGLPAAASVPDGVRVYVIGDVHGRSDLLERQHALIEADFTANRTPEVHMIYLGDYVDRGPDAKGVLDRLAEGPNSIVKVTLLRGNHEEMLLRFLEDPSVGPSWHRRGGLETLLSYGVEVGRVFTEDGYAGLAERFKQKLPLRHLALFAGLKTSIAVGDYFFCHAGVRPGVPLERQRQQDLVWIRRKFLDATENFGKVIVHGHSPVDRPDFRENRINIDTGAFATGRLTCLVLEGDTRRILST